MQEYMMPYWLSSHSPMTCHLEKKTIEFEDTGKLIKLYGLHPKSSQVHEISMETFAKWVKGNAV
jgi:hypothetical protein